MNIVLSIFLGFVLFVLWLFISIFVSRISTYINDYYDTKGLVKVLLYCIDLFFVIGIPFAVFIYLFITN